MILLGLFLGLRFFYLNYIVGQGTGLIQSVILSAALLIVGFQVLLIGLVADLIAFNRKILEEVLYRIRSIELGAVQPGEPSTGTAQQAPETPPAPPLG